MKHAEVAPLLDAATAAVRCLDSLGLPTAIVGGFAVAVRGRPRVTKDIDFVVLADLAELTTITRAFEKSGFTLRQSDAIEFAKTARVLLLRHIASGIDVDLSFGALPFERELVQAAQPVNLSGRTLPIARAEDLIIMKSIALRARDVADIEGMVELNDDLDLTRVRRTVAEFTAALEDADFSAELERILGRIRSRAR